MICGSMAQSHTRKDGLSAPFCEAYYINDITSLAQEHVVMWLSLHADHLKMIALFLIHNSECF